MIVIILQGNSFIYLRTEDACGCLTEPRPCVRLNWVNGAYGGKGIKEGEECECECECVCVCL